MVHTPLYNCILPCTTEDGSLLLHLQLCEYWEIISVNSISKSSITVPTPTQQE